MEVVSPVSLWREYDRKALPLSETVLSERDSGDYTEIRVYFSGDAAVDGVSRIYARFLVPAGCNGSPAVLYMAEAGESVDGLELAEFIRRGYAVLAVDYCGSSEAERFTIYPRSQCNGNFGGDASVFNLMPDSPRQTCWYIWTVAALRSFTYLESKGYSLDKVAFVGVGTGGAQVVKCAALENFAAGVTVYPTGHSYKSDPSSNDNLAFKTALDSISYAPLLKTEILMAVCSNDRGGTLDRMSELYSTSNGKCRFTVAERAGRFLGEKQRENLGRFLEIRLKTKDSLPKVPEIRSSVSDGSLYMEIAAGEDDPESVELFVAYSEKNGAFRNWHGLKPEKIGPGAYLNKVPVYDPGEPVYAFASVNYTNGLRLSSDVISKKPDALSVKVNEIKKNRLIYDSDMGLDDFVSVKSGGSEDLSIAGGPFGIEGLYCSSFDVATYKVGDVNFKGDADNVLQLIIYTRADQELIFKVTDIGYNTYECTRALSPFDDWTKIVLSAAEFKGETGTLSGWDKAICFEAKGKEGFIINSMLWA